MSPKTPVLFKEPLFYIPVIVFLALSIIVSAVIAVQSNLTWDLTFEGFNFALVVFKIPLGLLAICGTWAALVAANHRSKLTIEQIKLTNAQNVFTNYFKHLEEFSTYINKNEKQSLKLNDIRDLHDALYGSFDLFQPRVKEDIKHLIFEKFNDCYDVLYKFEQGGEFNPTLLVKKWFSSISKIEFLIGLESNLSEYETVLVEHKEIVYPLVKDYEVLIRQTVRVFDTIEFITKFSMDDFYSDAFIDVRLALAYKENTGSLDMANLQFDYNGKVQSFKPLYIGLKTKPVYQKAGQP